MTFITVDPCAEVRVVERREWRIQSSEGQAAQTVSKSANRVVFVPAGVDDILNAVADLSDDIGFTDDDVRELKRKTALPRRRIRPKRLTTIR